MFQLVAEKAPSMSLGNQPLPKLVPIAVGLILFFVLFLFGGLSALSLTGRVLFVLLLPGFSVLQVIVSGELDFLERLIISPIIGMAYASLVALYLSLLQVPINEYTIILSVLLLSVPLLAYSWKQGRLRKTSFRSSIAPSTFFVLTLIMVASIVLISLPFPKNGILIPMGDDPATSTLAANLIVQQGKIPQSWAPYFPEQSNFTYPPAYSSIMAFLYLLDPSMSMPILVSLFSLFFAIIHAQIFVLTRRVLHDDRIAICAASFSALVSIGFYQMMITGRFPALVGVALTLNLLLFSYLYAVIANRKLLLLAGITLAGLFITYTVSFITATLFVILFFSFGAIFFPKRKEGVLGCGTVVVMGITLSSPWVFNILNRLMIEIPAKEYQTLLVWFDAGSLRSEFGSANLFLYYGYWLLLIGIVGLLAVLVRRRIGSFLLAWFLSIILLMSNEIFKIHFPGWYYLQSGAFLNPTLSFPLSVLAGIGFVKAYDFLKRRFQYSHKLMKANLHLILIATLLLATFSLGVNAIVARTSPQTDRISVADYNAIMWISNNTPKDAVVFNDHWVGTPSIWIPAISHRRITMPLLSISEVGWSNIMFTRQDESIVIARDPNSTDALSILKQYNVSYIFLSNNVSIQAEEWRDNYNASLFLQSPHYELAFNQDNAWVINVIY
jgi:hypothetical protein